MQPTLEQWLSRKQAGPKPKKRIRARTPERAKQEREYNERVRIYLVAHSICEVWCKENGWKWIAPAMYENISGTPKTATMAHLVMRHGAKVSDQVHHTNKRRGIMLLDERYWLAVCRENHDRIEAHKSWARANGFLLNF